MKMSMEISGKGLVHMNWEYSMKKKEYSIKVQETVLYWSIHRWIASQAEGHRLLSRIFLNWIISQDLPHTHAHIVIQNVTKNENLFIWFKERERGSMSGGRERDFQADSLLSTEPGVELDLRTWAKMNSWMLKWLSHPGILEVSGF